MRQSTSEPRYGLARCSAGASARGGRGGSSTKTAHTTAASAHTAAGNSSATPDTVRLRQPRDHQARRTPRPAAARSGGCPSPDLAAAGETSRRPSARWPNCCWPPPFRRAAGTRPSGSASAPRRPRTPPPRSAPSRCSARSAHRRGPRHSPRRSASAPCRSWASPRSIRPGPDPGPSSVCRVGIRKATPLMKTLADSVANNAMTSIDHRRAVLIVSTATRSSSHADLTMLNSFLG